MRRNQGLTHNPIDQRQPANTHQPAAYWNEAQQNEEPVFTEPPEWSAPKNREESRAFRKKALSYLKYKQQQAEIMTANVDHWTEFYQMQDEDFLEKVEDFKEEIEAITINAQADVGPAVLLQVKFKAYCQVLNDKCDQFDQPDSFIELKKSLKPWCDNHLQYVMAINDKFVALKTAIMQMCQLGSI